MAIRKGRHHQLCHRHNHEIGIGNTGCSSTTAVNADRIHNREESSSSGRRKRKRHRPSDFHPSDPPSIFAATASKKNTKETANFRINPLVAVLLRAFVVVAFTFRHPSMSGGGSRGRIAPMLLAADAWTTRTVTASKSASSKAAIALSKSARAAASAESRPRRPFHLVRPWISPASRYATAKTPTALYSSSPSSSSERLHRGPIATAATPGKYSHRLFSTATNADGAATSTAVDETDANGCGNDDSSLDIGDTDDRWKESPLVNPTVVFETLLVPNSQLTRWITHPDIQHRLAKPDNWDFLQHVHPRIKLVQNYVDDANETNDEGSDDDNNARKSRYKQLLLMPSRECDDDDGDDDWLSELLSEHRDADAEDAVRRGPTRTMSIAPHQLTFQYLLKQLLPESALPPPSAYEQIGHVAHFNLKEHHLPHKRLIGSALLESTTSGGDAIRTVVNKVGQVDGKFRTYECEILANVHRPPASSSSSYRDGGGASSLLETTVVEDGISIELNIAECYWCTRLSGERRELLRDILGGRKTPPPTTTTKRHPASNEAPPGGLVPPSPLVVADVFCGAGAVCMLLAKKIKDQDKPWKPELQQQQQRSTETAVAEPSVTILANDWNPKAIEYMKRSIAVNGMDKENDEALYHKFELSCGDSYDFLSALGEELPATKANPYVKRRRHQRLGRRRAPGGGEARSEPGASEATLVVEDGDDRRLAGPSPPRMPDHVLMNFPLEAPRFLGSLRWWSWKRLRDEVDRRGGGASGGDGKPWYPRFHVYTFARSSSPRAGDEDEMAVNLVADELLPRPVVFGEDDDNDDERQQPAEPPEKNAVVYRREELNEEFETDFSTRVVRDVAPGKVVVCVAFSVTPKLIRYMQGDFS